MRDDPEPVSRYALAGFFCKTRRSSRQAGGSDDTYLYRIFRQLLKLPLIHRVQGQRKFANPQMKVVLLINKDIVLRPIVVHQNKFGTSKIQVAKFTLTVSI